MKRLLVLALLLFAVPAHAGTWYVDSAAAGSHDGTSRANAWTTFAQISQAGLTAGDTVLVYYNAAAYNERFTISKGGTSASARINYVGVPDGSGNRPVLRGVNGSTYSYIGFIGFEITHLSSANNYNAIQLTSGGGWLIQDCYIHHTYEDGIRSAYGSTSSSNIVRNCKLEYIQSLSLGALFEGRMISFEGDHNLIEYNIFGYGLDRVKVFGVGNVVRNNYDSGTGDAETAYTGTSPYPFHIDFVQIDAENNVKSQQVLVDRNFVKDIASTTGNAHFVIYQDAIAAGFNWFVTRFNVVVRIGEAFDIMQAINSVWFYNNTASGIYNSVSKNQPLCTWNSAGDVCDYRNNSFNSSPDMATTPNIIDTSNRSTNFAADYNHRYSIGAADSLPSATHNIGGAAAPSTDPVFNAGTDNFTIQVSSPLKAAGGPITTAVGDGSNSTALTVAASKAIFDGWGIADADWIKIGGGAYVQISSINYDTNVVTLTAQRSWSDGDAVIVQGMEDVGALPYNANGYTISGTLSSYVVTVPDSSIVRGVQFKVAGVPSAFVYTVPGSNTYTDPNSTADSADIYALYASTTPVVAASADTTPPTFTSARLRGSAGVGIF